MKFIFLIVTLISILFSAEFNYGEHVKQSFDIEKVKKAKAIVIFVHGGAWVKGDKLKYQNILQFFKRNQMISLNMNYRLVPDNTLEEQISDVAKVVAIAHNSFPKLKIFLIGHSSGSNIASLVATDEKYLKKFGTSIKKSNLKGVISLDGPGFDLFKVKNTLQFPVTLLYTNIFGKRESTYKEYSPITYIDRKKPSFLIFCSISKRSLCIKDAEAFKEKMNKKGNNVFIYPTNNTHKTIASTFGNNRGGDMEKRSLKFISLVK